VVNLSCSGSCALQLGGLGAAALVVQVLILQQRLLGEPSQDTVLGPLAEAGIFAIRNLAANSSSGPQPDLTWLEGAAPDFVAAMLSRYQDREGMVEASCAALCALAVTPANRTAMATRLGVFARVFAAAAAHPQAADTVEACLRTALAVLDTQQQECVSEFSSRHVLQAVQCLESHRDCGLLLRLCCQLLLPSLDGDRLLRLRDRGQLLLDPQGAWIASPTGSFEDIHAAWELEALKTSLSQKP